MGAAIAGLLEREDEARLRQRLEGYKQRFSARVAEVGDSPHRRTLLEGFATTQTIEICDLGRTHSFDPCQEFRTFVEETLACL